MFRVTRQGRRTLFAMLTTALLVSVVAGVSLRAQEEFTLFIKFFDVTTGEPIADVTPAEITIFEDDQPRETVTVEPIDWPVKLYILVDNSAATGQSLERIRQGVRGLLEVLPDGMAVEIVSTAPQPRFIVRMTTDRTEISAGVDRIVPDSGGSAFVDAMVEASDRIDDDDVPHFPVVLMVSANGNDSTGGMDRKLRRLQEQTIDQPVTHHFVILTRPGQAFRGTGGEIQTGVATQLSQMTGGRHEALSAAERITTLLPEIGAQIAASQENQRDQVRVTYERPRGAEPPQEGVGATVSRLGVRAVLTFDGRMP
jgi:hypothetical protein